MISSTLSLLKQLSMIARYCSNPPFAEVCSYAPAPLLCLRTLKAELGCGMAKQGTDRASSTDETWLTDGRWGVVHFAPAADE